VKQSHNLIVLVSLDQLVQTNEYDIKCSEIICKVD